MKELFRCTNAIAHIRVSPLVARTKKPCRFSHGRTLGKTTINPSTFPAPLASSRAASACRRRALASSPSLRAIRCRPPMPDIRKITVRACPTARNNRSMGASLGRLPRSSPPARKVARRLTIRGRVGLRTFTSFGAPGSPSKPSRKDTPGPIPANMLDTCCEAKSS
jgi:hypothetical protein